MPQLKSADSNPTNSMNRNDLRKETKPTFSCLNKHENIGKNWKKPIKSCLFWPKTYKFMFVCTFWSEKCGTKMW